MISYPKRAITALAYLFRPYNDLDIYVEDTACRNLYEILINRMLEGKAKVERIFQLGGRDAVINECRKNQGVGKRNVLFIIDGDFDILVGREKNELEHFYQLQVYCSENLIVTEEAVYEIAKECLPNSGRDEITRNLNYLEFMNRTVNMLRPLFSVYATVFILDAGLETCGYNVTRFLEREAGRNYLSKQKLDNRINWLLTELKKVRDEQLVKDTIIHVQGLFMNDITEDSKFISGKTYIIPLLYHFLHDNVSFSGTLDQLKVRLARYCGLNIDVGLSHALKDAARGLAQV